MSSLASQNGVMFPNARLGTAHLSRSNKSRTSLYTGLENFPLADDGSYSTHQELVVFQIIQFLPNDGARVLY